MLKRGGKKCLIGNLNCGGYLNEVGYIIQRLTLGDLIEKYSLKIHLFSNSHGTVDSP